MPNPTSASSELNEDKLKQMKVAILTAESEYTSTRSKTRDEMVDLIKRTIVSIADKTY